MITHLRLFAVHKHAYKLLVLYSNNLDHAVAKKKTIWIMPPINRHVTENIRMVIKGFSKLDQAGDWAISPDKCII